MLRMLNPALEGFLPWFSRLRQAQYFRLLVWWLSMWDINLRCNCCKMEATVVRLFSELESSISSLSAWSRRLYTFILWRRSQQPCSGTWATQLTWMLGICFTCRLFDSMLEIIVAVIYRKLMSVHSGYLNFCYGSCASLCIIDLSRD